MTTYICISYGLEKVKNLVEAINSRISQVKEQKGWELSTSHLEAELWATFGGLDTYLYRTEITHLVNYYGVENTYIIIRKTPTVISIEIEMIRRKKDGDRVWDIISIDRLPRSYLEGLYLHRIDILKEIAKDFGIRDV